MSKKDKKSMEVKGIVLIIDGEKKTLTIEKAKKLQAILNDLFEREIIKEIIIKERPYHPYFYPYVWTGTTDTYVTSGGVVSYNDVTNQVLWFF